MTRVLKRQVDQLQRELSEHVEILEQLRSVPEAEAILMIRRLKSTPNASMVLSSLQGGAHTTTRLSELKTSRGVMAPTDSEIEFELGVLHGSVYPVLLPLDLASIDMESLFARRSRKTSGKSSPASPSSTNHEVAGKSPVITDFTALPLSPLRGIYSRQPSRVPGPIPDRQYCDRRLNYLKINYWTCVPISDEFAACVLSHYLESDHPIYACVDVDLFLSDLVDRTLTHCSPFLVSALMSFACVRLPAR